MTAVRPALAIRVASVSQPLVCATVSLTTGADSVSLPAHAAPTDIATQRQACATAIPAGGHPRVFVRANASQ